MASGTQLFFTVDQRGGHWWFISPEGRPFFSLGMNHLDSATLRYPETVALWREKYGNDQRRWLRESVAPDLQAWGFNTIGWTQEVVLRGEAMHRHSPSFSYEEYQWAGMPYCHMLPFIELHQWECETRHPDIFSTDFADWCDYVARRDCARMADDPKLIGYFYTDCPAWTHARKPHLKGPLFDPDLLATPAGRRQLADLAERYYRITRDAVRRYDPNHLILGDRYEGAAALPDEVLAAAAQHVDVLSFQFFADQSAICPAFECWHEQTGLPILLADSCAPGRDAARYAPMLRALRELPCCVGFHYCGAYLKNRVRAEGFRSERDEPDEALTAPVREANRETLEWVAREFA